MCCKQSVVLPSDTWSVCKGVEPRQAIHADQVVLKVLLAVLPGYLLSGVCAAPFLIRS